MLPVGIAPSLLLVHLTSVVDFELLRMRAIVPFLFISCSLGSAPHIEGRNVS